jgi:hypothetical protein
MERTHNQSDYKHNSRVLGMATPLLNLVTQRNYYGPIIGNERSLQHIRHYSTNSSLTWADDHLHPCNPSKW